MGKMVCCVFSLEDFTKHSKRQYTYIVEYMLIYIVQWNVLQTVSP